MQYLLSPQEYQDLISRAKTPEQIKEQKAAETMHCAKFLRAISQEINTLRDPSGNSARVLHERESVNRIIEATEQFAHDMELATRDLIEALEKL